MPASSPISAAKKTVAAFISMLLAVSLVPAAALADGTAASPALPASGVSAGCSWSIDAEGNLVVVPAEGASGELGDDRPWLEFANHIVTATVGPGVHGDASAMFRNCLSMTSADVAGMEATSTSDMFAECHLLESVSLAGLDISSATDVSGMFSSCNALSSIEGIAGLDTSQVTDMAGMFDSCSSLVSLDLSSFSTVCVQDMQGMFRYCSSLKTLDLSSFGTSAVNDMTAMFDECRKLEQVKLGAGFVFKDCTLPGGWWRSAETGEEYTAAQVASERSGKADTYTKADRVALPVSGINIGCAWSIDAGGNLVIVPSNLGTGELGIDKPWLEFASHIKSATIGPGVNGDASELFKDCVNMTSVEIEGLDATSMDSMFAGCSSLEQVKLADGFVFKGCTLPDGWWRSKTDREDRTALQVANERAGIADTYMKVLRPVIIEAPQSTVWKPSMGTAMVFRSSAPVSEFVRVSMDGKTVDAANYNVKGGSTVIELKPSYLTGLPEGAHTVGIVSSYGTASASITLEGTGRDVSPTPIDSVLLSTTEYVYNGTAKTPSTRVTAGGRILTAGVDYDVSYPSDVTNAGTKTVTVTGKGRYTGKKTVNYTILKARIDSVTPVQTRYEYDGIAKYPAVIVKSNNYVLNMGTDYTVSYPSDVTSAGTKIVTVTGKGNYTGTKTGSYQIVGTSSGSSSNGSGNSGGTSKPGSSGSSGSNGNAGGSSSNNGSSAAKTVTMLRLYNPNTGEHLFTSDTNERDTLVRLGWKYEGQAWKAPASGDAVYRLYNPSTGEHHYTTDSNEYKVLQPMGWKGEGVFFYSDPSKGTPVYRLFNPHADAFTHHYTTDSNEYDVLKRGGWNDEAIGWYGLK